MIDDENHPRMIKAHKALLNRLGTTLGDGTRPLTKGMVDEMFTIIRDHKSECRQKGIKFPDLVVLAVPDHGIVEFIRADLDTESIRTKIVNFVRQYPRVSMQDVVAAFRAAYPDLRPDDVSSSGRLGRLRRI